MAVGHPCLKAFSARTAALTKEKRNLSDSSKHAVIHVFDIFRVDSFHLDAVKTWQLIDTLYENNSEILAELQQANFCGSRKPLFESIQCSYSRFDEKERSLSYPPGTLPSFENNGKQSEQGEKQRSQEARDKNFDGDGLSVISIQRLCQSLIPSRYRL